MDVDSLYQNLLEMGFDDIAIEEAINCGYTSVESALNFLTSRQGSNKPLTFEQSSNFGGNVLKLGRGNQGAVLSDSTFPFSKPLETLQCDDACVTKLSDVTSKECEDNEPAVQSRYKKNSKDSVLQMEHQKLIKEMKEDKERKNKAHHEALQAIHEDRQAIKNRSVPVEQSSKVSDGNAIVNAAPKKSEKNNDLCRLKIMIPKQSPYVVELVNSTALDTVVTKLCDDRSLLKDGISLCTQFPKREFHPDSDYASSLKELQLHPSATLMCKVLDSTAANICDTVAQQVVTPSQENQNHIAAAAPPPPHQPMEVQNENHPVNFDQNEDMDIMEPVPQPNMEFPNWVQHGDPVDNENEFVPFQGSGYQLIPQNPDVTPIYHNRRPKDLAGNAALERFSTERHRVPHTDPSPTTGLIQPTRLTDLCYEFAIFYIRKSNRNVIDNVRLLPEMYSRVIIERFIKDMLFTHQIAKLFKDNITYMDLACKPLVTNTLLKTISLYWKRLKTLILDGVDAMFTDEGIWELKDLPNLQHLSMKSCKKITDYGLQVIAFLPHLHSLHIRNTHITDTGFARLRESLAREPSSNPVALAKLDLAGLDISCESLPCLGNFHMLTYLDLSRTRIHDPLCFPDLPNLCHLNISHCENLKLTRPSLQNLNQLRSLREIKCRGLHQITLTDFLSYLSERELVNVDGLLESCSSVTIENMTKLSEFPLNSLDLESCDWLSDEYLQPIGRISTLSKLSISNCHFVTLTGLLHLVTLPHLESISLIGLPGMKEKDYSFVVPQFSSSLFHITISGINESEQEELINRMNRMCKYKFTCNARCNPIPSQAL